MLQLQDILTKLCHEQQSAFVAIISTNPANDNSWLHDIGASHNLASTSVNVLNSTNPYNGTDVFS